MKSKIWYRANNPEKNKIGIWRHIERVVHHEETYSWIKWRGYKWVVVPRWNNDEEYELRHIWCMGK